MLKEIGEKNVGEEEGKKLLFALHEFKKSLGENWEVNSTGIVACGTVSFDGKNAINVAGTIDLLLYNPKKGQYAIVDMKSSLAPLFKDGKLKNDPKTQAKLAHWVAQQTLYKQFLESKFGIKISKLGILPFGVNYSTNFSETDYEIGDDGVLRDKGIVVDIQLSVAGKTFALTPKTDVKYQVTQLPESVKRLMPKKTIISKSQDESLPVQNKLMEIVNKVPEGSTLKSFISKKYADNQDVQKLADILEENKTSTKPILMTKASQDLLLMAIDQDALEQAIQQAEAQKQHIIINNPPVKSEQTSRVEVKAMLALNLSEEYLDMLEELPDELYTLVPSNLDSIVEDLENGDIDAIRDTLLSKTIRHKKAKTGNYKVLNLQQELKWLNKNLPQVSKERRLKIVKGLIACSDGTFDFGRVEHSIMVIGTKAEEGTMYHEAFHYVVQFLLTDDEINNMFKAAEEKYGKMPIVALEEKLADDFADYVRGLDPNENKIRKFFRELWNAIKAMFMNRPYTETLFRNINTGVYSGREFRDDRDNVFRNINPETRKLAKNYEYLTQNERDRISEANVSSDTYNQLTKDQQAYMLHCVI